jgi:hypothetical protein
MNLAVVSGTIQRKSPFYKGIGSVKVGLDITCQCFMAVLLDTEGDIGGTLVIFEARWCWRYGSSSCLTALRLL